MKEINNYNPQTGVYNDSLTGDYLWSSVNTREATPDVMTPYTWSAMRFGFSQMSMLPGYLPVGNICGRIYNNASVGATAFQALGRGNSFDASSREMYGINPNEIDTWNVPLLPLSIRDRLLVFRNAFQIMAKARKALKTVELFVDSNPSWCKSQQDRLTDLDQGELHQWAEQILMPYLVNSFWWMVGSAIDQANWISKLRQDLLAIVSPDATVALLSNVSTEDDLLASLGIVVGLDWLRRGKMSCEAYLQKYGHRGPHEAEVYIPRPAEDPDWIKKQMDNLELSTMDVDTLLHEQRLRYESALANLQKAAPIKFDSLLQRIQEAARLTRLREGARSEVIRTFWVSRNFILRTGSLCNLGEDAFFLEYEELLQLLGGNREAVAQIPARKKAHQKFSALPQYPTLIMGKFDPVAWAADPHRPLDIYDARQQIKPQFTSQIKGLPGSAGQAEGRVRILHSLEESDQLQPGEILVAITTNVGWTPIFPRAAAVITDVGAPLSHAAIVARELGIPAVVGCFNATSLLKTGDRVRLDGGQGIVEILERSVCA
jgi:phosphoenolpyruvate synthase/pyruvate phosphate dikinase